MAESTGQDRETDARTAGNTAFADPGDYVRLPRLARLALSSDGRRLVTTVSTPSPNGKKYSSALWELDPTAARTARRLTRSAPGESGPVFLPDGGLLFTSRRPDPEVTDPDEDHVALWLLPAGGGEARQVANRPQGITSVAAAESGDILFTAPTMQGSANAEDDAKRYKARKDAGVSAILHESYPVRFWDHDLGPSQTRIFAAAPLPADSISRPQPDRTEDTGVTVEARDLTPSTDGRIEDGIAVNTTGSMIAYVENRVVAPAEERTVIVVADANTGHEIQLIAADDAEFGEPQFSPDSTSLICVRSQIATFHDAPVYTLWQVDLRTGEGHNPAPSFPLWPTGPAFSADGLSVFFTADEQGHSPVFRLDLTDGSVTRLTAHGAHTDLVISRDGSALYALRSSYLEPPTPVRLDPSVADQDGVVLPSPAEVGPLPGTLTEVRTQASDGTPLRAWLALPHGTSADSPAPLLLWIHGGPLGSWNAWSWRWCPWLMVARGYAVLLPDPALSTGYGQEFIQRGWGEWGGTPFTDLMSVTDAACARDDIDDTRTAAMGGSFGGYMANWVATHTDRFKAIVTHASLWNIEAFSKTTDAAWYWLSQFGNPLEDLTRYRENSPHLFVRNVRTPMLVIHGDKDYRVPIGEGLALWHDLVEHSVDAKFLYFPDENHWVLTPGHAQVCYETVTAFVDHHVLGNSWKRPDLL
jgi:dipeptidyl aminopeptidase/acylaminoacyl peptidase